MAAVPLRDRCGGIAAGRGEGYREGELAVVADKPARPGRTSLGANHRSTAEEGATEAPGAALGASAPFEHGSLRRGPGVSARLTAWLDRFFFDRELFIRSKDRVRYVRLSAGAQKIAALTVVAVIGWAAAGSLGHGGRQDQPDGRQDADLAADQHEQSHLDQRYCEKG